ncbi:MAG: class I SAM-dependent rRNA methyltransferase [Oscillochloris sp.]|nr:class I SAM-dependent rRNA methyltransferase [Oscillochloris sp.]
MATITLRPGRERPVIQRHPWVFSGAIAAVRGDPLNGEQVDILSPSGDWLARGFWSGCSQIRVRLCTWDPNQDLDAEWLHSTLARAIAGRAGFAGGADTAYRLVFSESDGLPGLIVDRYGAYLSLQILTQGMEVRRKELIQSLVDLLAPHGIYERSDAEMREKEGLPPAEGLLWGEEPPDQMTLTPIAPLGSVVAPPRFLVDLHAGQKTGSYLDQALNRARVAAYCAGADLLDCFAYSGGFSVYAARAG